MRIGQDVASHSFHYLPTIRHFISVLVFLIVFYAYVCTPNTKQAMQPYRVTVTNSDGTLTWSHDTPAAAESQYLLEVENGKAGDTITIEMLKEDGVTWMQPAWNLETSVTL